MLHSDYGLEPSNLDNYTDSTQITPEGANDPMAYRRIRVFIGNDSKGKPLYTHISGSNQNEINDKIVEAYIRSGRIFEFMPVGFAEKTLPINAAGPAKHSFQTYAEHWYTVFCEPNVELATALAYRRQLDLYWIPAFVNKPVEDITAADIQNVLNDMGEVAKDTKKKAIMVLRMILAQAIEDGFISKNAAKSTTIKIRGKAAQDTEPYSIEQMQYLVAHIPSIKNPTDKAYLALAALHPLRPEEVFGLKYGDVDWETNTISVQRAVTYPDRNQPVIKTTKTEASVRTIDLAPQIRAFIPKGPSDAFIIGGDKPLSYQQIRRMRGRIKKDTGFNDDIVPRRFRTTVLTDLYDQTKDIKQTQAAAGHTTADMTLKHYVKGRQQNGNTAAPVASRYGLTG